MSESKCHASDDCVIFHTKTAVSTFITVLTPGKLVMLVMGITQGFI